MLELNFCCIVPSRSPSVLPNAKRCKDEDEIAGTDYLWLGFAVIVSSVISVSATHFYDSQLVFSCLKEVRLNDIPC